MALIGEALISASVQVLCDRITSAEFVDLFRHKKLDKPLLMKLNTTLLTLNVVLDDAEEKQMVNPAVRKWLDELKHAVFDAEDLLDEIDTEALRRKLEGEDQIDKLTNKVWNFLSSHNHFYQSMNVKIQELLQRLESFVQQKSILGLREGAGKQVSQRTPTTSLVHEPCFHGRDEVIEKFSKVLLSDDASKDDVSVLTIVGMGGVGKTTLARMLYNDDKVKSHFTFQAWACISEDYDAIRITKTLLESVTSKPCTTTDLNLLQVELREQLRGKKFLFVLDDLWNEDYTDWKFLQTPFTSGARGSKVIITTRNTNVASIMQNVPIQYLEPLSNEDCWLLLAKHAFGNENYSAHPNLEEIGKQIARKCNGLPLVAQTLGGVLRCKKDSEEWNKVLNSSIWDLPYQKSNILPALGLSYHYLPATLKRCFVYCSIFPKDYEFKIEDVVFLWMGEGLIPQAENVERMEEVAKEYFNELLSRSLFQKLGKSSFTMHDLINDLAVFMSKGFCSRLEGKESHEVERVRHLSYASGDFDVATKFKPLNGAKCTRELINLHHLDVRGTKIEEMPVQMGRLKSLRTLIAFVVGKSTGSSIGELRELLRLGGKLSILNLQNVVDARDALQANMKDKKDLKELELSWGEEDADDSQKEKDVLDKLQPCLNLEKLTIRFYGGTNFPNWLGDSSFSNIQVMHLSDCTYCWSLPPVGRLPGLKELCIERMKSLKTIGVEFYGRNGGSLIQPFQCLERLEFRGMEEWEEWVPSGSASASGGEYGPDFPRLQELILIGCPKLRGSLPYELPCLKKLRVSGCQVLLDVKPTTTTTISLNYKSLKELRIEGCQAGLLSLLETKFLSQLYIRNVVDLQCLPNCNCLQSLDLSQCPTLSSFPKDGLPTTLTSLSIYDCRKLEFLADEMLTKLTSLDDLYIWNSCDSMRFLRLGIFPKLTSLSIGECENLESLSIDENLSHLNNLCFPLSSFSVHGCEKLKSFPKRIHTLTALRSLSIGDVSNLESFAEDGGLPPNLRHFGIKNCKRLRASSSSAGEYCNWGLQALVSLEEFRIRGSDHVLETLLKEQLLPTTLRRLNISFLSTLKSLDGKGLEHLTSLQVLQITSCPSLEFLPGEELQHLTSLQNLDIRRCDSLQCLPEEGLPPSLQRLSIYYCSALEERYKNKTGQDWAKISHIPCVQIGNEVII
ncbi:putative disease resistance RPP13-like protein 1 [Prunus avium]|uniref:Disease resistance RPP13-like protein 1 n=1 Tax=Prunus avium TaxID=42229 RepID=A0A6P5U5G4_PRUAV|nr:putative disease resistance RPP13-like protein 1 [Prunus avium]